MSLFDKLMLQINNHTFVKTHYLYKAFLIIKISILQIPYQKALTKHSTPCPPLNQATTLLSYVDTIPRKLTQTFQTIFSCITFNHDTWINFLWLLTDAWIDFQFFAICYSECYKIPESIELNQIISKRLVNLLYLFHSFEQFVLSPSVAVLMLINFIIL